MGEYGPATTLVNRLIDQAGKITLDEAADLYRAHTARLLIQGSEAERVALARAYRAAAVARIEHEYEQARHAAATAWRHALPERQGPWLVVGQAIANAAGALVVSDILDDKPYQLLVGPWRQAMGALAPVGPSGPTREGSLNR